MSAERVIVNALQEQPILLLPVLVLIYLIIRMLVSAARAFSPDLANRELR